MAIDANCFKKFSEKQLAVLTWWCSSSRFRNKDAIICDGAVRSGKTVCMSLSFIFWSFYDFEDTSFALCGKTIASLKRNLITPMQPLLSSLGFTCKEFHSKNLIEISYQGRTNRFYLFGGTHSGHDARRSFAGRGSSYAALFCGADNCQMLARKITSLV